MQNNNFLVSPGESIQVPDLPQDLLRSLVRTRYGLEVDELSRLPGYDDLNYRLRHVSVAPNSTASPPPTSDLMLKFTNPIESEIEGLIEGQVEFCLHLHKRGIPCPEVIQRKDGRFWAMETVKPEQGEEMELPFRMFSFLPGEVIQGKMITAKFLYKVGEILARIHQATEDFHHPVYDSYKTHWSLSCADEALKFAYTLEESKRKLVEQSMKAFRSEVLPIEDQLPQGQIHGDLNESNMLALPGAEPGEYVISAVLDLWDTHRTCYVYDLAMTIMYLMLLPSPSVPAWDVGAHILFGYFSVGRKLSDTELRVIPPCISARFVQSLVYGHYTHQLNPDNTYALNTQAAGWELLQRISELPEDFLRQHWLKMLA